MNALEITQHPKNIEAAAAAICEVLRACAMADARDAAGEACKALAAMAQAPQSVTISHCQFDMRQVAAAPVTGKSRRK